MGLIEIKKLQEALNLEDSVVELYGKYKAKLDLSLIDVKPSSKLILVTAVSPTPAGEGKTTTNIGLSMALNKLGYKALSALREPSLGPNFGMKGGATGGGKAQVLPMEDINLHFTGDIHAITSANNLLAALIDNHIYYGNSLNINPDNIVWHRSLDMNDRALRSVTVSQDDPKVEAHPAFFDISVASEVMAVLCLAESFDDLKDRLSRMIVAYTYENEPVYAGALGAVDAMVVLLKDAMRPNLVQTTERTPAIIHGGPFANIAHGCNSIIATKMGLSLADYVVTEAGFGSDLGAEKFINIKCRQGDLAPHAIVLVATIRSLKYQGGVLVKDLNEENVEAMVQGYPNLKRHIEGLQSYGVPVIVAINRFPTDTDQELSVLLESLTSWGVHASVSDVFSKGGEGALDLARVLVENLTEKPHVSFTYDTQDSIHDKLYKVASRIYHAASIEYSDEAKASLEEIEKRFPHFQVCIAKTQYSFTDNPKQLGAPDDFTLHIKQLRVSSGAGFVVALVGEIMTMPGLPRRPQAENIGLNAQNEIYGIKG